MAVFADRMRTFTEHLHGSIQMRGEALSQIHATTEDLLGDARTFLGHVADERQERAEELRATLASHRKESSRSVAEMRQGHQDSLRKMRDELQHMLSETRKARQEGVQEMAEAFEQARRELADDLRQAANTWQEFAARVKAKAAPAEHHRKGADQQDPTDPEHTGRIFKRNPSHGKRAKAGSR